MRMANANPAAQTLTPSGFGDAKKQLQWSGGRQANEIVRSPVSRARVVGSHIGIREIALGVVGAILLAGGVASLGLLLYGAVYSLTAAVVAGYFG